MVLAGDEAGRTQQGNNNAYCQDNEISWIDWSPHGRASELIAFFQRLTELRKTFPMLRRGRFLTGEMNDAIGVKDVSWVSATGEEMRVEDWEGARCFGMLMDGRAQPTGISRQGSDATLLLLINAHHEMVPFTLPDHVGGQRWSTLLDTDVSHLGHSELSSGDVCEMTPRSLRLLRFMADEGVRQ